MSPLKALWNRICTPPVPVPEAQLEFWRLRLSAYFLCAISCVWSLPVFLVTGQPQLIGACALAGGGFSGAYLLARHGHRRLAAYCAVLPLCGCLAFNTYNYGSGLFETAYFIAIALAFLVLERDDVGTLAVLSISCLAIAALGSLLLRGPPPLALDPGTTATLRAATVILVGCTFSLILFYVTAISYKIGRLHRELSESEAASRAKSTFIAHMSHELRTPMNGVLGVLSVLEQTKLDPSQRDFLATAHVAGESLLGLLNDILDLSRIEAGELVLDRRAFALRPLIDDIAHQAAIYAKDKDLELVVDYRPGAPEHVVGDAGRVRQILLNLTTNAIKFTSQGHVCIRVEGEPVDRGDTSLRLSVIDTGIGISPDDEARVFDRFHQVDSSSARAHGGAGLGLTITRRLVSLMEGTVGLKSRPGEGSEFSVELRLPVAAPPTEPPPRAPLEQARVLLVEPHPIARSSVERLLAAWGAEVVACASYEQAVERLRDHAGEPASVHWWLGTEPGQSGTERTAREALDREAVLEGTRRLLMLRPCQPPPADGSAAIIRKPVRRNDLMQRLREAAVASPDEGPGLPGSDPPGGEPPLAAPRVLLVEDNPINQKVAARLLAQLGCTVDVASSGVEALQMLEDPRAPYALVFMDIQMPQMDGLETTAAIRRHEPERGPHLPIVALTAHAMEGDEERFLRAGMDDYLPKPVRRDDLRRILSRFTS